MTRQRAISHLKDISMWGIVKADEYNALKMAIKALEKEPKNEDMITHIEAVQDNLNRIVDGLDDDTDYYDATYHLEQIKEKVEQEPKTDYKAFAEWVSTEIFSKDWEYNKDSFAEIACRKLNKLGVVDTDGTMWIYENEALEQEPKTERKIREELNRLSTYRVPNSNTDLVSRNAVERVLNLVFRGNRDKEPKTGHWIEDFKNSVMCSCCKQQFHWEDYDYDRKEWITTHDRCPFCGAEMEVSE